jgi:hypothetical protein
VNDAQIALAPSFGPSEARRLTDQVKSDAQALWQKLVELYEGGAWSALNYPSWHEYCATEFGFGRSHSYRLLEAGRVAELVPHGGMNERQARELAPVLREDDEEAVVDLWCELREEYGEQLTAEKVRAAVEKRLKPTRVVADRKASTEAEPAPSRRAVPMSERDLQRYVLDVARARGWLVYHTFDSRRSQPGFPDLILLRADRQVVTELKVGRNKPTDAQELWLDAFHEAGAQVCVWREGDLDAIAETLR